MTEEKDILNMEIPDQSESIKKNKWSKVIVAIIVVIIFFGLHESFFSDKRQVFYYPDEKVIESRGDFNERGRGIGLHTNYRKDGTKSFETNFNHQGELDGISTYWFDNGQIRITREYMNGVKMGEYKEYNREGKLLIHEVYEKDSLVKKIK